MLNRLRSFINAVVRRDRFERAMAEEMHQHVEAYADDLERAGHSRAEALRRARLGFGGAERLKEECRQARGLRLLDETRQDLRYATRQLATHPGFAAAAILSLALGIGANTAIFSVMDAVLLKTVPVRDPQQLHFLAHGSADNPSLSANYPLFDRYRTQLDVFAGITAYNVQQFKVATAAGNELVDGQFVAGNYHDLLGVPLLLGRGFASESDRPTDGSLVAVISEPYWSRRFARDPGAIGKTTVVQGKTVTIVGVTAAGFHGLKPGAQLDITLPLSVRIIDDPEFLQMHDTWTGLNLVARLAPGVTAAQALASADTVFQGYMAEPEQAWLRRGGRLPDAFRAAQLLPAARGTGALRRQYDRPLRVLMAMVGVFLLIACANVANLMLVRASTRVKEVAVRISIGAGRARLVRQFLTESLLLALAGGVVGLFVSLWATYASVALFAAGQTPVILDVGLNARVLAFTATVSILTGLAFGVLPALSATRVQVTPTLKEGAGSATAGPLRLGTGRVLAVCQVALCVLLIATTGLLVRSFRNLSTLDPGFQKDHVLLFYLDTRGTDSQVTQWSQQVLERLQALPGVRAASFSTASPLATDSEDRGIAIPGLPAAAESRVVANNRVTPDYFATLDIRTLRGRGLMAQDSSTAAKVAVINETMARAYFGEADPVGRTFSFTSQPKDPVTIVGVVRDARERALREPAPRMAYVPLAQADEPPPLLTAAIRTAQEPRALEAAVRDIVRRVSPDLLVSYVRTLEEQLDASLVRERVLATLSIGFGVLALLLACVGLYGVMAYGVARRAREIGIRVALGAQRRALLWQVIRDTLALSAAGIVIGLVAALASTRLVSTFLFGVSARDPLTLIATIVVLAVTSLAAGYLPARRAASVDPMRALRAE